MNFISKFVCSRKSKYKKIRSIDSNIEVAEYYNKQVIIKRKNKKYNHEQELYILDKLSDLSTVSKLIATDDEKVVLKYFEGGDLLEYYLNQREMMPIKDVCNIIYNLCHIVDDMHEKGVYHLDLKLENICLGSSLNSIYVIDFSESIFLDDNKINHFVSTCPYMSPEYIIYNNQWINKSKLIYVDTWSIGIIMYALIYGMYPFGSSSDNELNAIQNNILNLRYKFYQRADNVQVPPELIKIIKSILIIDGSRRPSMGDIRNVVSKFL